MTIKDVALEAKVSTATVSRVLNNRKVKQESKIRVEKAIEKLGYVPNALAQGLMQKKSKTIGTLITSMTNAYYMEITDVIEKRFGEMDSMLFLSSTDGKPEKEKRYLESLISRQVEGIIMIDPTIENFNNGLYHDISRRTPLILIHSFPALKEFWSVYVDQYKGMERVMNYLWDMGHRKIAFVRGFQGHSFDVKEKCWRDFYTAHQLEPDSRYLVSIPQANTDNAISMSSHACQEMLKLPPSDRPTAIFTCNDLMALGAINAASVLGMNIPDELSIIGHDNTNLSKSSNPQLTTVDMKLSTLGNQASNLLIQGLNHTENKQEVILIEPELIVRQSSGAVPL
ncbi:LacI family DNA-binding transcriptional regulator [Spirochaeta cellobiosiphila]|uniref:LacI family DNA-binding transcriptional regulator n=1 Tax=Spirochaeta cellobiosiphila TaxID=504483 RepID=UPI00040F4D9B|nr:LacI family DNA-binding transcriptional regulator [Spirochaeta cellobiosiphila]